MRATLNREQAESFERFWREYPRKIGKGAARRAWAAALRIADEQTITAALQRQLKARLYPDPTYTPYPSTWLNQERWEDEIETRPPADEAAARARRDAADAEAREMRAALAEALAEGDTKRAAKVRYEAGLAGIRL